MLPDLTDRIECAIPVDETSKWLVKVVQNHKKFMEEDLAKSGLKPGQLRCYADDQMPINKDVKAAYRIPYFNLDGSVMRVGNGLTMHRIRMSGTTTRYIQPSKEDLASLDLPVNIPYILPETHEYLKQGLPLHICEGEKKAACVMHHIDVPTLGIGGCWSWGISKKLHPWTKKLIQMYDVKQVVIVPDGDILRYDICTAYGTLTDELLRLGVEVEILQLPSDAHGIDDLIVDWGPEAQGAFAELGKCPLNALVISQQVLAEQYGLSTSGRDARVVINETNIRTLLDKHPMFEQGFWLNTDTNQYVFGTEVVQWDHTDFDITCRMQHHFQLHNLQRSKVTDAMRALAETNKRSPFMDWVHSVEWDGVARLENWPIRLWGCPDTEVTRAVALRYWVGMYARMANPGCKMDWMLVTVGGQGIGKSWWAELVTRGHSVTFMASGNAKDDAAKMHRGIVICIDELDAFNKREMTYWKTMISNPVDTYRPPYGRGEVTQPRGSVLYGTSNHPTFLRHDDTGQRRFGVLEPKRMLDVEGFKAELGQLWAEAAALYTRGAVEYWTLPQDVQDMVAENYQGEDLLAAQVQHFLDTLVGDRFRMMHVMEYLGKADAVTQSGLTGRIKDKLIQLGCEYKKSLRFEDKNTPCAGYIYKK